MVLRKSIIHCHLFLVSCSSMQVTIATLKSLNIKIHLLAKGLRKPEEKLQSHKNKVALSLLLRVVSCLIYANANVFSSEIF